MPERPTAIGIRALKAHLSHHLRRVRAGAHVLVTERGRTIGIISPVGVPANVAWAHRLVAEGRATWNGSKPGGGTRIRLKGLKRKTGGKTAASIVLEDRE